MSNGSHGSMLVQAHMASGSPTHDCALLLPPRSCLVHKAAQRSQHARPHRLAAAQHCRLPIWRLHQHDDDWVGAWVLRTWRDGEGTRGQVWCGVLELGWGEDGAGNCGARLEISHAPHPLPGSPAPHKIAVDGPCLNRCCRASLTWRCESLAVHCRRVPASAGTVGAPQRPQNWWARCHWLSAMAWPATDSSSGGSRAISDRRS